MPRKKTAAQKRADKREYERSFQKSSLVAQHYRGRCCCYYRFQAHAEIIS